MHRSGTSCLAGCLEDCGLNLGEVNRLAPHNRKGNNESERIRDVQDAILSRVGASWNNPPTAPIRWTSDEKKAVLALIPDSDAQPWGFKDPRSVFLLDGWFEIAPDLRLVATFRHPLEVAASLAARDGFDMERATSLWSAYNAALMHWRAQIAFPLVRYTADKTAYLNDVRRAAGVLRLDPDATIEFRDESLNHNAAQTSPPSPLLDLWQALLDAEKRW